MEQTPVTTRRTVEREPEDVWRRMTSPEGFEEWMGAGSSIDLQPGGQLVAADVESGEPKTGEVIDVDHGKRVMWAWRPLGRPDDTSEVEIELVPAHTADSAGTEIVVTERPTEVALPWITDGAQACASVGAAVGLGR